MEQHAENKMETSLPNEVLMNKIYVFRGQKVMLDSDLAELYGVETKVFKQAVRRNIERFPPDFMFELDESEFNSLRSQIVTSKNGRGGSRYFPMVFTEQGVSMLSSVLKSKQAIQINIQIMRIFTKMRQFLNDTTQIHLELADMRLAMEKLSKKQDSQGKNIDLVFEYIDRLENKLDKPPLPERDKIGYKVGKEG
ncbi:MULTISPECIES: ORF6N domain-containing protein [Sphingobacterium]|uniref:ORF6N domain-containing protein n=1 Tax=Sphingobacterium TaxID=28453 RepID=UPI001F095983|nr:MULTISPECIES: ORF6N domain-containing protein [unclassified Sphingobacterium]